MKKYISVILLMLIFLACSDDFLDFSPKHRANVNDFYSDVNDFETALIGAYGTLKGGGLADELLELFDLRADNATAKAHNGPGEDISEFTLDPTHSIVNNVYTNSYRGIQACNAIIHRIENVEIASQTKDQIIGEAKFIRALRYFYLVNVFGDVPLVLDEITGANLEDTREMTRTTISEVYQAIVADLKDAEEKLESFSRPHRASALAAKAMLGKVYLFQKDYAAAAAKLKEVINSGRFDLVTNYLDLFRIGNTNNIESIFAIEHIGSSEGTGSGITFQLVPKNVYEGPFRINNQNIYVEENLYNAYSLTDTIRRDISARKHYSPNDAFGADTVLVCDKYFDENPFEFWNASNTVYIIRYADVLLMCAEALNKVNYMADGESFTYLNGVLNRAGLESVNSMKLPNQTSFDNFVFEQRRLELAMEGHRWLDLIRTDRVLDVMNAYLTSTTIDQNDLVYPIPQREILNNPDKIKQNTGY